MLLSNGSEILAVQVKVSGYLSGKEKNELIEWAEAFHAVPVLARKKRARWSLVSFPSRDQKQKVSDAVFLLMVA